MKSNDLHLCQCGNVYDDWETYEKGTMPTYGLELKVKRGRGGKILKDKQGNTIYCKCHVCSRTKSKHKSPILSKAVLEYLKDNEFVTSDLWKQFEYHSRYSMTSTLCYLVKTGVLETRGGKKKNQKYYLTK